MNRTDLIPEQLERFQLIFLIHDEIACIKTARKSRNICQKIIQSGNGTIRSFQPIEIFHGYCYFDWKVEDNSLQTAYIRDGEPGVWTANEVRKIRDGYYLIGSGVAESVGYDIKVLVEVDENFNPVYPSY